MIALAKVEMAYGWIYVIFSINFGLPICACILGWWMNKKRKEKREAEGKRVGKPVDSAKVAKQRRLVERNINEYTLRFLVSWTSIVIIASCLAAELIFIGQFEKLVLAPVWAHTTPSMIQPDMETCAREAEVRRLEYIGFGTWKDFTGSCCCMPRTTMVNTNVSAAIELWMCRNESVLGVGEVLYKERQRIVQNAAGTYDLVAASTFGARPFCGTTFMDADGNEVTGREPSWNPLSERLEFDVKYANGTILDTIEDYW